MTRPFWWALALATLASGARYVDYSESKMPDYGSAIDYDGPRDSPAAHHAEVDEYHEHTREVPVPAEYKYEEDRGKADKRVKEVGETDEWQNSLKKQKKYSDGENQEIFDNYNSDELASNYKSNHRPSKHRSRLKSKNPQSVGELARELDVSRNKPDVVYNRNRKKEMGIIDGKDNFAERGDDFEDDKDVDFEEERISVRNNHRNHDSDTTLRTARRKPRDRYVKSEPEIDEEDPISNLRRRPPQDEFRPESATHAMRRPQYRPEVEARAKDDTDKKSDRFGPKKYDDYSEYYDMKRVLGMKEKLLKDQIHKQQSTSIRPFLRRSRPRARYRQKTDDASDGVEGLRRLLDPLKYSAIYDYTNEENKVDEPIIRQETTTAIDDFIKTIGRPIFKPSRRAMDLEISTPATTRMLIPTTTPMILLRTTTMMKPTKPTITAASTTNTVINTIEITQKTSQTPVVEEELEVPKETTELSLAEKSRLSILKKAQRKEMLKGTATNKPPVLLQVTNVLHTLVMVEPPTSLQPWQRVSVVHKDTPDNVLKVKRLMRKKLVDNAKDVHDLAENWDDMVCDYIDMALLETRNASVNTLYSMSLILFSFMAITIL